jgi:hypothetical protein
MKKYLFKDKLVISASNTFDQKTLGVGIGIWKIYPELFKTKYYFSVGLNVIFAYLTIGVKVREENTDDEDFYEVNE